MTALRPDTGAAALADALQARAPDIARRAVHAMYADPFWEARFGDYGRRRADEDGDFHVGYLRESLRLGSVRPFGRYAAWLRDVLVTRGMCSRHLSEQLAHVGGAIEALDAAPGDDGRRLVREYIAAGRAALLYEQGSLARAIQDAESDAADAAARALADRPGMPAADAMRTDAAHILSYVADAAAFARHDLFLAHAHWLDGFMTAQGRPPGYVAALREALAVAVGGTSAAPEAVELLRLSRDP